MRRREFIAGIAGATAWPVVGRAQQPGMPVVGFLHGRSPETTQPVISAFRWGLAETGFVEGRNVFVEYRLASGHPEKVPTLAAELVSRRVNVLASGYQTARAAVDATSTIPIVFMGGPDPVAAGLVASLNRPGGNVTGVSLLAAELISKRVELLNEMVPKVKKIGALIDGDPKAGPEYTLAQAEEAGRRLGLSVTEARVGSKIDFDDAFASFSREAVDAIVVTPSTLFNDNPDRLVELATRYRIPTSYELREFVQAGGLMSYAPSLTEAFRLGGVYTGRILKGEKPANLPVMLPTKFELALNLKTAKALGLTIPETLLATADEVIQ
jgi:putative tryptophan/tyrosine transport system substrate-binding protein